ncbi:hypothetical protein J3F83DRAFT_641299 [Trichoderma novae-zelandiae]
MLTHRGCYLTSVAFLVLFAVRRTQHLVQPWIAYEARVAVALRRRPAVSSGRRLFPRFADQTGRLTSSHTPYLSLADSNGPSWQGSTGHPGWGSTTSYPGVRSTLTGLIFTRGGGRLCSSRAARPMTQKSYSSAHTHTRCTKYQDTSRTPPPPNSNLFSSAEELDLVDRDPSFHAPGRQPQASLLS